MSLGECGVGGINEMGEKRMGSGTPKVGKGNN